MVKDFLPRRENHDGPHTPKMLEEGPVLQKALVTPETANVGENTAGSLMRAHSSYQFRQDSPQTL